MPMTLIEGHAWEDFLMEEFKAKFPNEKIPFFGSTWKAQDWLVERIYKKENEMECLNEDGDHDIYISRKEMLDKRKVIK